jgi:hypothetical protein
VGSPWQAIRRAFRRRLEENRRACPGDRFREPQGSRATGLGQAVAGAGASAVTTLASIADAIAQLSDRQAWREGFDSIRADIREAARPRKAKPRSIRVSGYASADDSAVATLRP